MRNRCNTPDPSDLFVCTRDKGHDGPHVSQVGTFNAAWTDEPTPTPEPRTLTWRSDGTGCTWDELEAELREGRQAERVMERGGATITHRGPLRRLGGTWCIGAIYDVRNDEPAFTSITVWLPEVPEWAQGCVDRHMDHRLVATDDGRVWEVWGIKDGAVTNWIHRPTQTLATTEELAAMKARLIVDRDGKAVER